jgi:hypothetical protein
VGADQERRRFLLCFSDLVCTKFFLAVTDFERYAVRLHKDLGQLSACRKINVLGAETEPVCPFSNDVTCETTTAITLPDASNTGLPLFPAWMGAEICSSV